MLEPGLVSILHRLWPLRTSALLHWSALPTPTLHRPKNLFPSPVTQQPGRALCLLPPGPPLAPSRHACGPCPGPACRRAGEPSLQSPSQPAGRAPLPPALFERMSLMCISTNFIQFCPKLRYQPQCPHQTKSGHASCLAHINKDRWGGP